MIGKSLVNYVSFNGIDNSSNVADGQQHLYHGGILEAQTLQKMISAATFLDGQLLVVATSSCEASGVKNASYRY